MLPHNTDLNRPSVMSAPGGQTRWPRRAEAEALTLLASRELGLLLDELRPLDDLIPIDASLPLPVADPRFLVNQVDGVALIVASEQASRSAVRAASQETPEIETKILGALFNRVQDDFARNCPDHRSFHKVA